MAAKWSATGSTLAVVDNYNIYLISTAAKPNHAKQITFGGRENLYYGITDWVYRSKQYIFVSCKFKFKTFSVNPLAKKLKIS